MTIEMTIEECELMSRDHQRWTDWLLTAGLSMSALALGLSGCEKKEPVLKIETPRAKIEVEKSPDGGSLEITTESKPPATTEPSTKPSTEQP
jgi:hypothetical protein